MVPYLSAAFERYAADGTPPFRALALDWPDRAELSGIDDAWMVGDRMMVAPLFAGEPGRTVTMPPGVWHDFWTGAEVKGGSVVEVAASGTRIPVYVKGGAVMPLAAVANSVADPESRQLAVKVYGDGGMPFEWAGADGSSMRLEWRGGKGMVTQTGAVKYSVRSWSAVG